MIQDLKRQLDTEKDKNRNLEDSYKFRVTSFDKRETQTRNKIDALEQRLNAGPESDEQTAKMTVVRSMHKDVVDSLDCIQNNTAKVLQEQEKDLMKAFRSRLSEVAKEHEELKNRKGEHSSELQAKHRKVMGELYEAQELAQKYDKENLHMMAENKKMQERLVTREDDRQALLKELVVAKKELARLKAQCKDAAAPSESEATSKAAADQASAAAPKQKAFTEKQIQQAQAQQSHNRVFERECAYKDAIQKLKRMLESERSTTRGLKSQHIDVLQRRTELEGLLRQCLDDVKAEVFRSRGQSASFGGPQPFPSQSVTSLSVHDLSAQDRERVLELLLSQQRVVQLLYSRGLAHTAPALGDASAMAATSKSEGKEDDFSWLGNIIPECGGR